MKYAPIWALLLATTSAMAGWVEIGSTRNKTYYLDYSSVRKAGNAVQVWYLENLKRPLKDEPLTASNKIRAEYDCSGERWRLLSFFAFSEKNGSGSVVFSDTEHTGWVGVMPGTMGETLWEIVCRT